MTHLIDKHIDERIERYKVQQWKKKNPPTEKINATKTQFEIEKLKKNGTFNHTN